MASIKTTMKQQISNLVHGLIYKPGMSRLPWPFVVVAFCTELVFGMTRASAYTYLPKLIKTFGVSETNTGKTMGYIGSSLVVGSFIASFGVGYLADRLNKKHLLMSSLFLAAVGSLAFGVTQSIPFAIFVRFFQGIPGLLVVAQSLLLDQCDTTNRSVAMAFVLAAFSVGMVLGPAIGGFLAFPDDIFNGIFKNTVFTEYPILLPNLVIAVCYIALLIGTSFMYYQPYYRRIAPSEADEEAKEEAYVETVKMILQSDNEEDEDEKHGKKKSLSQTIKSSRFYKVITDTNFLVCASSYSLFGFTATGFNQLYPLWASTIKVYGGLNFTTQQIGKTLMYACIPLIFFLVIIISKLTHWLGIKKMYLLNLFMLSIVFAAFPFLSKIQNESYLWLFIILSLILVRISVGCCFTAACVIVANCVDRSMLGTAYGLFNAALNLASALAPSATGTSFSWSLLNVKGVPTNHHSLGFPFDQHFAFLLMALMTFIATIIVLFIRYDEDQKEKV